MNDSYRLLIVSNRLPISGKATPEGLEWRPAGGGLATGLRPWHERGQARWIGWPGDLSDLSPEARANADGDLRERGIIPLHLSRFHVERFYQGFSNRVLWPLFHYLIDRVPVDATGWDAYRSVNEQFADLVAREWREDDLVWIHDYQLMLLPALVRARLPRARIGFFLHIPFPSSEVFRILPWRRPILMGLLGADLIGFHTFGYLRHFLASLLHVDGVEADVDRVRIDDREVQLGVFPMGVDADYYARLGESAEVLSAVEAVREDAGGRHIVVGVDRLDYTKGIPRRLQAVERLLQQEPGLRDWFRYIQVAVPSRGEVDSYQRFKRLVEEMVGRINGAQGTARSAPVHYLHRSISPTELTTLYRAADVMLVTPLRDGMNLVAKEFVASRTDDDGVLVLSEFAGAASELAGAVVVNPYDVDGVAEALQRALKMSPEERRTRMKSMRTRVAEYDINTWVERFVAALRATTARTADVQSSAEPDALGDAIAQARRAGHLRLCLDYDGTLVPIAKTPELAAPDPELMTLIERLATTQGLRVEIVSGRHRDTLESWFGSLPVALWAEHGFWSRSAPGHPWRAAADINPEWADRLLPILKQFTESTPGSRLELKTASLAWHFRNAQRDHGPRQAHELRMLLGDALSNQPVEVLEGKKVIEVRMRGISKAVVARRAPDGAAIVAFGDDHTDEDLFRALPASSITVAVGRPLAGARYVVSSPRDVRHVLRSLLSKTGGETHGEGETEGLGWPLTEHQS